MSKSKGNVLDPLDLIDGITLDALIKKRSSGLMQPKMAKKIEANTRKEFPEGIPAYGTDALRFTFCAIATPNREIRFELGRLEGYRNFCNKIWNAARYVLMNTQEKNPIVKSEKSQLTLADRWIVSRLQHTIKAVNEAFTQYRFDFITQAIYEFIWNEYCDWYLELSKPILTGNASIAEQQATRHTLLTVLEICLRLAHPLIPFITEDIWQQVAPLVGKTGKTIMLQSYPAADATLIDHAAEQEIEWLKKIILAIRNIRGEINIAPKQAIPLLVCKGTKKDQQRLENNRNFLMALSKLESITVVSPEKIPPSSTAIVDELELHVPMANLIDKAAETARLKKEIAKQQKDVELLTGKLKNENYLQKAPPAVVAKDREKIDELKSTINKLNEQLQRIANL